MHVLSNKMYVFKAQFKFIKIHNINVGLQTITLSHMELKNNKKN